MNRVKEWLVKRVWGRIEANLAARWPEAWPRVRKALLGWKTIVGVVVIYTPEILDYVAKLVREAGYDPASVVVTLGSILAAAGALHKLLKLLLPEEPVPWPDDSSAAPGLVTVTAWPRPPVFSAPRTHAGDDQLPPGWIVTRTDYDEGLVPRMSHHWGRRPEDARRAAEEAR